MVVVHSPYTPGSGARPAVLVGRDRQLTRAAQALSRVASSGEPVPSVMCLTGARGMGKTVTLDVIRERAERARFVTASTSLDKVSANPQRVAAAVADAMGPLADSGTRWQRWRERLATLSVEVSAGIVKVTGPLPPPRKDAGQRDQLTQLLIESALLAREHDRAGLAIFLDELQEGGYPVPEESDLVVIANSIQDTLKDSRKPPVAIITAGLPDTPDKVMAAATFTERFDFRTLGPLDDAQAEVALLQPALDLDVAWARGAAAAVLAAAGGSPYLLQLYGTEVWQFADPEPGDRIEVDRALAGIREVHEGLSHGMFRGRWSKATPAEQEVLAAVAHTVNGHGVALVVDVSATLGKSTQQWSKARQGVLDKGPIEAPARGQLAFTIPGFDRYVRELTQPDTPPEHTPNLREAADPPSVGPRSVRRCRRHREPLHLKARIVDAHPPSRERGGGVSGLHPFAQDLPGPVQPQRVVQGG